VDIALKIKGNKKTIRDCYGLHSNALKLLEEDDLRQMKQLINKVCAAGGWSKNFTEVVVITFKK
jgi:hypothetical protein